MIMNNMVNTFCNYDLTRSEATVCVDGFVFPDSVDFAFFFHEQVASQLLYKVSPLLENATTMDLLGSARGLNKNQERRTSANHLGSKIIASN